MNESIIPSLLAEGWREYPDFLKPYARSFFRRFETPTQCACNHDKLGIQVIISVYTDHDRTDHDRLGESVEVELLGELSDGTWIKLFQWALNETDPRSLIPRLLSTWEHIANDQH